MTLPKTFLTGEPLPVGEMIAVVARPGDGGIAAFVGVVRDENESRPVSEILYEAYPPMAESEMRKIADSLAHAHPEVRLLMLHRIGRLRVGEASVAVVASAPHRSQAFAVCRAAIDRIKKTVPIWKKEIGPHGEMWVGTTQETGGGRR